MKSITILMESIYLQIDIPLKCPFRDVGDAVIFSYVDHVILRYMAPQIKLVKPVDNSVCIDWCSARIIIRIVWPWHGSTVLSFICLNISKYFVSHSNHTPSVSMAAFDTSPPGVQIMNQFPLSHHFRIFFMFIKTRVTQRMSRSFVTGNTATKLIRVTKCV